MTMFGNSNNGEPPTPPLTENDFEQIELSLRAQVQQENRIKKLRQELWEAPKLRTWKVLLLTGSEVFVEAHGITHARDGSIVFSRFVFDFVLGPQPVPVRAFKNYVEYTDVTPVEIVPGFLVYQPSTLVH